MSIAKWSAGLLAGMSMFAYAAVADAGEVRVTVAEYSAKTGPYFEEAKKEFEAANPGITINFEIVPWDVLLQKLTTDMGAGSNADLSIIGTRWLIDFVKEDAVEPLDNYVTPEFKDRFIETFLSPSIMDGKTYGLPIAASARAMYYNKELLEKAGVANPPATWAELKDAAAKIKDSAGGAAYGFGLQGKEIETDVYYYYAMWSQGTEILNEDGTSGLSTPGALEAAKLYKSLIDEGLTQPGVTSRRSSPPRPRKKRRPSITAGPPPPPGRPARAAPMASPTPSSCSRMPRTRTRRGNSSTSCSPPNSAPSSRRTRASCR